MIKFSVVTVLLLSASVAFAQKDFERSLDSIQTLDDVNLFFKKNKKAKGKVIVFNKEKHKTQMAKDIFNMSIGSKKYFKDTPQKTYYKVIEKYDVPYYRASCVYLDGSKLTKTEIHTVRQNVLEKFGKGYMFNNLAKQYSMDNTAKQGGDLGWFTHGDLHPDFEAAIFDKSYSINDIFTLDIPEMNAYYVVLITEDKKIIEEAKVLKVTEPRK